MSKLHSLLLGLPLILLTACGTDADPAGPAPEHVGQGLVILAPAVPTDAGPATGPAVERPYYHSFGEVRDGSVVSHVFRLENRDPGPVTIQRIKPACGCTVPRVRYVAADGQVVQGRAVSDEVDAVLTIPPGRVAEVEIEVDTREMTTKNAHKTLTTLITTDSPASYYITLETHVYVQKLFDLVPNGIDFGRVPVSGERSGTCDVVQAFGSDLEVVEVVSSPPGVEVALLRDDQLGRPLWRVEARLTPQIDAPLGRWTGELVLSTRNGLGEPDDDLVLGLQADRVEDLIVRPLRLVFVARDSESVGQVEVASLLAGHRFGITGARFVQPEHEALFAFAYEPAEPALRGAAAVWNVRLWAREPAAVTELVRGELELALDDPQHPSVRVAFVVHPRAER